MVLTLISKIFNYKCVFIISSMPDHNNNSAYILLKQSANLLSKSKSKSKKFQVPKTIVTSI